MLLSARLLNNAVSVNSFEQVPRLVFGEGDAPAVFFQLIDKTLDRHEQGYVPAGRRYVPAVDATLSVILDNLDDARKVTRAASQPFAQDPSIWKVQLLSTDTVRGTINLKLTLTEGSVVTHGFVPAAIGVDSGSNLDSTLSFNGGTIGSGFDF